MELSRPVASPGRTVVARLRRPRPAPGDRSTLRRLSRTARLPASVHFQRRVAALLDGLRAAAPPGAFRVEVGPHRRPVDVVDLLRVDLLQSVGSTLGFAELLVEAGGLAEADRSILVPVHLPELSRAARVVGRDGPQVVVRSADSLPSRLRVRFHPWVKLARSVRDAAARDDARPAPPSVLLVAQVPAHVGDLAGVAARLRDGSGRAVAFLVPDRETADAVTAAGFEVARPGRVPWPRLGRLLGGAARAAFHAGRVARRGRIGAAGGREQAAFAAGVTAVVADHAGRAVLAAEDAADVLAAGAVDAVVVANPYSRVGRAAARVAGATATPVVAIEHGSIFPDDPRWDDCPATAVCAWGEPSRRALVSCGVPVDHVEVTGAPRFDDAAAGAAPAPGAAPADRPAGAGEVLVATSGPGDHVSLDLHLRVVEALGDAARATPDRRWTIKLHPKDRTEHYEAVADLANVTIVGGDRSGRSSIFDHLARADCLITVSSTTALDALRAGVPVVGVWLTDDQPPEFVVRTAARLVGDGAALAEAVEAAARGELPPPDPAYLDEHFAFAGEATDRVVSVIEGLIAGAGGPSAAAPTSGR